MAASLSISRERSPMAFLLNPKKDVPLGERDVRLDDYLNDKIQTAADLGNLQSLIANVEIQKEQLEQQLRDARTKLAESKQASANHSSRMLEQTKEFEEQHATIQKRLMIVTSSDTPEEAVERLKGPMEKLRRVELARDYVELLKEVDDLAKDARKHLPADPKEALKPYTQLKELAISVRQLQDPAEGAAVHLVTYVENASISLWVQMKRIMSDEFESVLKRSNWPDEANEPTREWSDSFEKLLDLQAPEIMAAREPLIILPMNVMAKSFVQQFRYHFFSDKATNLPHHLGELFFDWFVGTVKKWEQFLRENVGPILAAHFRGNRLAGNTLYVDPVSAFITALLPVLREKVDSVVADISHDPGLLSQFINQLLNFDDTIRGIFNYDGGNPEFGWKGLTWEVLDKWFDRWIQVEKDFALERYQVIIKSPDSGLIDYDSTNQGKTKTTYGAAQVTDLVNNVSNSYNKLRRFSHKMRFLIEIQAEIFDQYQGRLSDSLDAYQTFTNPVARKLHGISKEQQAEVEGIKGLESLCKVYASTEYIINILNEWSNQEFFVDLWDQLQERAKASDIQDNLAGSMSYTEVKDATSTAVGSDAEGSVFDVTISEFRRLRSRAEEFLTQALKAHFQVSLRPYFTRAQWTTVGDAYPAVLTITPELDQPLQTLQDYMTYLHKTLAHAPFRRVWRAAFDSLQELLWHDLLLKQDFTTLGAARLMQDLVAIQSITNSSGPGVAFGMPKLKEGVLLLNLPLNVEQGLGTSGVSLMEASKNIYATNSKAAEILAKLGFTHITRADARAILARRVEASE